MSLLLDALKRAEDAKRAKAAAGGELPLAAPAQASQLEAPPSDLTGHVHETLPSTSSLSLAPLASPPVPAVSPSDVPPPLQVPNNQVTPTADADLSFPTLTLSQADARITLPDSVSQSSNPAYVARKRDITSLKPLSLEDEPSPIKPVRNVGLESETSPVNIIGAAELDLAQKLQAELGGGGAISPAATPVFAATAAYRAARSQQRQREGDVEAEALALMPEATLADIPVADNPPIKTQTPADAQKQVLMRGAAKNVFDAKTASRPASKTKWVLPVVAVMVFAVGIGSWYIWNEVNRIARPTLVGNTTPVPQAPLPTTTPITQQPPPAANTVTSTTPANASNSSANTALATNEGQVVLPPLLPPPARVVESARLPTKNVGVTLSPREAFAQKIEALPLIAPSPIRFQPAQASAATQSISPALSAGYSALQAGDYALAKRHYAEAIATNITSVDANLGFATAAARSGEIALAERHYRRVLEIDPRNATASAGLMTMAATTTVATSGNLENELRLLVAQDPSVAASHFALGNVYASERRWQEAQQSFFDAVRLSPPNPDYFYNLAVSLDHLGQVRQADEFYRRALGAKGNAQFDRRTVEQRVSVISQSLVGK